MSDQSRKPPGMSDADRAYPIRRRTTNRGIPVQVDHELTPPPQDPPAPSTLEGYTTIAPPIRAQLDMLHGGIDQLTGAVSKLWEARSDGQRLDNIDSKLGTLATAATRHNTMLDEFVVPGIKECMASTDAVALQLPKIIAQLEGFTLAFNSLNQHVRAMELTASVDRERFASEHRALMARVLITEAARDEHEGRIALLERKQRDGEVVTRALAKTERRKSGAVGAAVAAGAVAVVEVLKKLVS